MTATVSPVGELLALDPSINSCGVALYRAGLLVSSAVIKLDPDPDADIGARCLRMAQEIAAWITAIDAAPRTLVIEWPQVYRATKSKGDPNDLIGLAGVCGALSGMLGQALAARQRALTVLSFTPAQWAGQLPKTKTVAGARFSPRAMRIAGRLSDAELLAFPRSSHDAIDAVGLGLFALGRLNPVRVFPGCSG